MQRYFLQSRNLRALGVGALVTVVIGLVLTGRTPGGAGAAATPRHLTVLVPLTTIQPLQVITAGVVGTVSVPIDAAGALGPDPATYGQRNLVLGHTARATLQRDRVIDLSDLYGNGASAPVIGRDQALYVLPLAPLSYPADLAPDAYVDIHVTVTRAPEAPAQDASGTAGAATGTGSGTSGTRALSRSQLAARLLVSTARVYAVAHDAITVLVRRSDVPILNLMRSLGAYSFAEVSPDAPAIAPTGITPQQYLDQQQYPEKHRVSSR